LFGWLASTPEPLKQTKKENVGIMGRGAGPIALNAIMRVHLRVFAAAEIAIALLKPGAIIGHPRSKASMHSDAVIG
jgi:hypothetical protein